MTIKEMAHRLSYELDLSTFRILMESDETIIGLYNKYFAEV